MTRQLRVYFAIAYLVSWSLWLPRIATVQGWWNLDVPQWWHYAGSAGPITAALIAAVVFEGRGGLKSLLAHYAPSRVPPRWLAFAILSPLALMAAGSITARLVDGQWPPYDELARAKNLPELGLPLTLLVHTLTFGVGEETGWRGFALPRLQSTQSAMRATYILVVFWALWHFPTFFENQSFMEMGPFEVFGWLFGLYMGAIFLTWLFNSCKGSLLAVVTWHGLFNQFSASDASSFIPALLTMGVIAITIVAIWVAGRQELTGLNNAGRRQQHSPALEEAHSLT